MARAQDLFDWHRQQRLEQLEAEREALRERIGRLPRFSHQRVSLQARLCEMTLKVLATEVRGSGKPS